MSCCPNEPGCRHPGYMHDIDPATLRPVCVAVDRVPDSRARRYVERACRCGRG